MGKSESYDAYKQYKYTASSIFLSFIINDLTKVIHSPHEHINECLPIAHCCESSLAKWAWRASVQGEKRGGAVLPDGYSQILRSYAFGPLGFWTMAPLRYAAKFDPFLSLDCAPTPSTLAPPCPPPWRNPRKGRDQILPSGNLGTGPSWSRGCSTAGRSGAR